MAFCVADKLARKVAPTTQTRRSDVEAYGESYVRNMEDAGRGHLVRR